MSDASFVDAVAGRAGESAGDVARVLGMFHIPVSVTPATPHRLRVSRLMFEGTKTGVPNPGPFTFERQFGDGIWALVTERNEAGKSSVMEIIVWVLRGQPRSGGLQDDVHQWIGRVEMDATIDDQPFTVAFEMEEGRPVGTVRSGSWHTDFAGDDEFADRMSSFMMDHLGLSTFEGWQKEVGRVTQGWNTYTTTLYFPSGPQAAVLGTNVMGGLAGRLLLLFVGVPWSETLLACRTAEKQLQDTTSRQSAADDTVRNAADASLREIEGQIEEVRRRLAGMPDTSQVMTDLHTATADHASLLTRYSLLDSELADARSEARAASKTAKQERKRVQDLNEARRAQRLFHGMNPTVCPRCSTAIGDDRVKNEKDHDTCSVCARDLELDTSEEEIADEDIEDDDDVEQDDHDSLDARAAEMEALAGEAEARVQGLTGQLTEVRQERDALGARLETLREEAAGGQARASAEVELARLEARADQLRELTAMPVVSPDQETEDNVPAIITAAVKEADERVKDGFDEVVSDLNAEILRLGQRFGIDALQSVQIDRAMRVRLRKGDADTNYGDCTAGEQLRLRLAVVIAMLRVADQHGVGRHPGFVMIDSLGAEEAEAGNLGQFAEALAEVTSELGIQTIVASARDTSGEDDPILAHVPASNALVVKGSNPLW